MNPLRENAACALRLPLVCRRYHLSWSNSRTKPESLLGISQPVCYDRCPYKPPTPTHGAPPTGFWGRLGFRLARRKHIDKSRSGQLPADHPVSLAGPRSLPCSPRSAHRRENGPPSCQKIEDKPPYTGGRCLGLCSSTRGPSQAIERAYLQRSIDRLCQGIQPDRRPKRWLISKLPTHDRPRLGIGAQTTIILLGSAKRIHASGNTRHRRLINRLSDLAVLLGVIRQSAQSNGCGSEGTAEQTIIVLLGEQARCKIPGDCGRAIAQLAASLKRQPARGRGTRIRLMKPRRQRARDASPIGQHTLDQTIVRFRSKQLLDLMKAYHLTIPLRLPPHNVWSMFGDGSRLVNPNVGNYILDSSGLVA